MKRKDLIIITKKISNSKINSREELEDLKKKFSKGVGKEIPSNISVIEKYKELRKSNKVKKNNFLEKIKKRPIRSLSGVVVVSVLTKPWECPGNCIFCPKETDIPKSYLSGEPAVERAKRLNFDPYLQTKKRLESLKKQGHPTDKIELIVIGGTWTVLEKKYREWFIKRCFDGVNGMDSLNLKKAQKRNENGQQRIIGITLETRPDYITKDSIKHMRKLGCTRVEIGVQSLSDKILKKNNRGHGIKETIKATKLLKDAGLKICYHLMPGLYGSNPKKDLKYFKKVFQNSKFRPDMIKIYPCIVSKGSKLYKIFKRGDYKPYSEKTLIKLLMKLKLNVPPYVRINRLIRDVPAWQIQGGSKTSNLREVVQKKLKEQGKSCQCIRCREIKSLDFKIDDLFFNKIKYKASKGKEYFLSFINKNNKLAAFLRLRLPSFNSMAKLLPELKKTALIREVHTYGQLVSIKSHEKKATQHQGFGKQLMLKAEEISRKRGFKKIAVISGIGVRGYYKKLGYYLKGTYMIKDL